MTGQMNIWPRVVNSKMLLRERWWVWKIVKNEGHFKFIYLGSLQPPLALSVMKATLLLWYVKDIPPKGIFMVCCM